MTVIPDKHTFTIWQGATFNEVLTLYETNDRTMPRDLSGYTAEMVIRSKPQSPTPLITLNTSNGGITLQYPSATENKGEIRLYISATNTKLVADGGLIDWKSAVYDLTITSASNPNITEALLYGGIKVNGV